MAKLNWGLESLDELDKLLPLVGSAKHGNITHGSTKKPTRRGISDKVPAFPVKLKTEEPNFQFAHIISWDHARYAPT